MASGKKTIVEMQGESNFIQDVVAQSSWLKTRYPGQSFDAVFQDNPPSDHCSLEANPSVHIEGKSLIVRAKGLDPLIETLAGTPQHF